MQKENPGNLKDGDVLSSTTGDNYWKVQRLTKGQIELKGARCNWQLVPAGEDKGRPPLHPSMMGFALVRTGDGQPFSPGDLPLTI
jgi:hypothetical protein